MTGRSLVCAGDTARSEAILVENFDPDYLVFERASAVRLAGGNPRVLVPAWADPVSSQADEVAVATLELMARISRLGPVEVIRIRSVEPISLNAAHDIRRYLKREHIGSVTVVSPLFRSRRSALVYGATLGRAGIAVRCQPARGAYSVDTWTNSWHGIQEVLQQWVKLQYYRLAVLPFVAEPGTD